MNPLLSRVNERADAAAYPAVASLRKALSDGKDAEIGYRKWRKEPFTIAFLAALAEYADANPVDVSDTNKSLVQYGITCGLEMAYKLMAQPARLFPEIFGGKSPELFDQVLDQAYADTPDDVLDKM